MHLKLFIFISVFSFVNLMYSQENCNNGIDDNNDGLIDLHDTSICKCNSFLFEVPKPIIPNSSFEEKHCCPSEMFTGMNCVNNWMIASDGTTDYLNLCGYQAINLPNFYKPKHPLPDGNGYVGFYGNNTYKEYIGACLLSNMETGVKYQLQLSIANSIGLKNTTIAIYGTKNCNNLPFIGFDCPTYNNSNWELLDTLNVRLNLNEWQLASFNFTPKSDIKAIAIGSGCSRTSFTGIYNYYFLDDLRLSINPTPNIVTKGKYCSNNLILKAKCILAPNSYQWYKDSVAIVGETNDSLSVLFGNDGYYQVKISYNSDCVVSEPFIVKSPSLVSFETETIPNCKIGSIKVKNTKGGQAPYSYQLNYNFFQSDSMFHDLVSNNYKILVKDSNGCKTEANVQLLNIDTLITNLPNDTSLCKGDSLLVIPKSNLHCIYLWKNKLTDSYITVKNTDKYWVKAYTKFCIAYDTINVVFNSLPQPYLGTDSIICFDNILKLSTQNDFLEYKWQDSSTNKEFLVTTSGKYWLTVFNGYCVGADSIYITFKECNCQLYIPTAFSPNKDGKNETFEINNSCEFIRYNFRVFNRWGEKIFETNNPLNSWDGRYNENDCPEGIYAYTIQYLHNKQDLINKSGIITLLR
jgi:gliding motility-associated-like protein